MRDIKRQFKLNMKKTLILLFLVITFQLLSCLQKYDNPLSYNYIGDYQLNLTDKPLPENLEVLKTYHISFQNKGSDRYQKMYLRSSSPNQTFYKAVFKSTTPDTIAITFSDTFSGTLKLFGERPNNSKDSILICDSTVHVVNPYSIGGKGRAGIGDRVPLYICYKGKPIVDSAGMEIKSVEWNGDAANLGEILVPLIILTSDERNVPTTAKLITSTDSLELTYLTEFKNYTPTIDTFFTEGMLQFGSSAHFKVSGEGRGSDSLTYVITADTDTLLDTTVLSTPDTLDFSTTAIRDTSYSKFKLYVTNDSALSCEDSILKPTITIDRPSISIDTQNTTPAIDDSVRLFAIGKAHLFHWLYKDSLYTTVDNFITLSPYTITISDTVYVYGENVYNFSDTSFHFLGAPDSIILKPTKYEYAIIQKSIPQYIKTNAATSLQFAVVHGIDTLDDSTLNYTWVFSDTAGSKMEIDFAESKPTAPACSISIKDSIPFFRITIQASILNSNIITQKLTPKIMVRSFSPYFKFDNKSIIDSILTFSDIKYTSNDTSHTGGQVRKIYFQPVKSFPNKPDSIDNGTAMKMTFDTTGEIKVVGWAIDNEGNTSKKDTLTFIITITKPQFSDTIKSFSTSKGRQFPLDAKLVSPLKDLEYFWDTNNDGTWDDTTTKSLKDDITFNKEGTDTIRVKCKNKVGDSARMTFYVVVNKNAPIIDTFTVNDSTQYIKDTLKFAAEIQDPDSGLTGIFLHRVLGSIETIIKSIPYTSPTFSISETLIDTPNVSGQYLYILVVKDQNGNSDSSTIPVIIDKGIPKVDSTLKEGIAFAKHPTNITIKAQDNDSAYLKYFISYDNDTSFSLVNSNVPPRTYNDSGWKIYYVKVNDIDGQESPIYKDSIYVNSGAPLIKSIKIDSAIFIKTPRYFTITATDINVGGSVSKIFADWDNNSIADDTALSNDSIFKFKYHIFTEAGIKDINFWAIDNDGIKSPIKDTNITIHKGAPRYIGRSIADTASYWIKDRITFHFQCIDTNGTVQKMIIDWGDTSYAKKIDTISLPQSATTGVMVSIDAVHTFPKTNDKQYTISLKLIDNDNIDSTYYDSFQVKRGMPKVSLPYPGDTLFTRIANTGGNCTLSVSGTDPNDTTLNYYWKINGNTLDTTGSKRTTIPFDSLNITGDYFVNKVYGNQSAVFVKDTDGNMAGDTFYVYLDGPPPMPTIISPLDAGQYADTITFEWYGTDIHDSVTTQYQISIKPPSDSVWEKIKVFTSGTQFNPTLVNGKIHFYYSFVSTDIDGVYTLGIEAMDRSGAKSERTNQNFSYSRTP